MNQLLEEKYKELGISEKVYAFGENKIIFNFFIVNSILD